MTRKILLTVGTIATLIFNGCSDSYDSALEETITSDNVKDIINETTDVAKDKNVTLSPDTQDKINNLETNLTTKPIVSSEILNDVMDIIEDVKETIENSNLSTAEKESAINEIETIEREKLQEGLAKYTTEIQTGNTTNCSTNNTGSLPPMIPSDECLN
jgi:hypothetical protein